MKNWSRFLLYLTAAASWFSTQSEVTAEQSLSKAQNNRVDEIYLRQHFKAKFNNSATAAQVDELLDGEFTESINYGHRSHSSHSSHSSHYSGATGKHRSHISHQSHYSAYDSSGGNHSSPNVYRPPSRSSGGTGSSSAPAPQKDIIPVIDIQKQLNQLGYDCGSENGIKNDKTIAAIKKFQTEYDLPADGIVGWKTESWLNSTRISDVRTALEKFGYKFAGSSGSGRTTEVVDAIKDFQTNHELESHGRIDRKTKKALGLGG